MAVVGPGALGRVFAAALARVARVALVARGEEGARRLRAGYALRGPDGAESFVYPEAFAGDDAPDARWAIVLVKGPDTEAAAHTAARLASAGVLSLQNGWVLERLRAAARGVMADQGATTAAAWRQGEDVVWEAAGHSWLPPGFAELAQMMTAAGLPAEVSADIDEARLQKLAVNLLLNPLTAVLRIKNGDVLREPAWRMVRELAREMTPVLRGRGLSLQEAEVLELTARVARATADNISSMLADVMAGRPTEIAEITGVLLSWGGEEGVRLPQHQALYHLVRALEQVDRGQPLQQ